MSNNKQSMKLYTEEHLKKAINRGYSSAMLEDYTIKEITDNFLNTLTPIELPSDDEIKKNSQDIYGVDLVSIYGILEYKAFNKGAFWMRDKIQEQIDIKKEIEKL